MNIFDHYKKRPFLLYPFFTFLLLIGVMVFTLFLASQKQNTKSRADTLNCAVDNSLLTRTQDESTLLNLINNYRQQNNLPALLWSSKLKQAAAWMSNDMSVHNNFSHTDSLGRDIPTRITNCGYQFTSTGENIGKGFGDSNSVFTSWQHSPPHNANMLGSSFTEGGISVVNRYWTLDLGSSNNPPEPQPTDNLTPNPTSSIPTGGPTPNPSVTPSVVPTQLIDSPTPTPSGILINQKDTEVNVSIKLIGIGKDGNRSPKHLTRAVTVGIFSPSNQLVLTGNGFLKYDGANIFSGTIHLGQIANGTYYVKITAPNTLSTLVLPQFQNLDSESTNQIPSVTMSQGDLNADNVIDIKDYNLALPCMQNKKCQTKDSFDLNDDGRTDVIDYNLLLSSFRKYTGD